MLAPVPTTRFTDPVAARQEVDARVEALEGRARAALAEGHPLKDQDVPQETLILEAPGADVPPLLLLGGMGPLSGLQAFVTACRGLAGQRTVILHQACAVPDRTQAILSGLVEVDGAREARDAVVDGLLAGLNTLVEARGPWDAPSPCVIASNSAHFFLPWVKRQLGPLASALRFIELPRAASREASRLGADHVLLLATTGTARTGVFHRHLAEVGIPGRTPDDDVQRLLMQGIFEGVKGMNAEAATRLGGQLIDALMDAHPDVDALIAGCAEVPALLLQGKDAASPGARAWLAARPVINPVSAALSLLS